MGGGGKLSSKDPLQERPGAGEAHLVDAVAKPAADEILDLEPGRGEVLAGKAQHRYRYHRVGIAMDEEDRRARPDLLLQRVSTDQGARESHYPRRRLRPARGGIKRDHGSLGKSHESKFSVIEAAA